MSLEHIFSSRVAAILGEEIDRRIGVALAELGRESDEWLDVEQAAAYLHTTPTAVRDRARRGRLKAHRQGRRLYFRRSEIDRSIEEGR